MSSAWQGAEQAAQLGAAVVIVDLGRPGALGAERRSDSWRLLWAAAGARTTTVVKLVEECPAGPLDLAAQALQALLLRNSAWECMLWSRRSLRRRLAELDPDVVVFCTHRSFDAAAAPPRAVVILDLVDRLSENYRRRGQIAGRARRLVLNVLAARQQRLERTPWPGVVRTAAGREDARVLDAMWIPNVVPLPTSSRPAPVPTEDVLFLGSLDYAPNVEGLRSLERVWPRLLVRHPGARLLIAGRHPSSALFATAERYGWTIAADFEDVNVICGRARISVAPLAVATGIQNKVLETSAAGLAQIVHPAVLAGLGPDFPAVVASDDDELLEALNGMLAAPEHDVAAAGARARAAVERTFSTAAHAGWCSSLLSLSPVDCRARTYLAPDKVALRF